MFLCSDIIANTEYHIRVVELLLQSDHWDEKLPDCIIAPGLCTLLPFVHSVHLRIDGITYFVSLSDAEMK